MSFDNDILIIITIIKIQHFSLITTTTRYSLITLQSTPNPSQDTADLTSVAMD